MGLVLMPSEIKNSAKQIRANIAGNRDGYSSAMQVIQNFTGNDALKSESWDAAKSRIFDAHQSIVRGMTAVQDSIESDLDVLEASAGEEELLEDELIEKIRKLEEECSRYERMIASLQRVRSHMQIGSYKSTEQLIAQYRALLKKTKEELEIIKRKLQSLYEKADRSSALFQTIGTLLGAIESAINDAEVYISGKGTLSDGSWKVVIPQMINMINSEVENKWLPPVMEIDGSTEQERYLKKRIEDLTIEWNQEKIDKVWDECNAYYEKTGVQVDPRLLMAIVICEGTGSFNTSKTNRAADGQNGVNSDFDNDVELAVDLLGGKIIAYSYYREDFSKAREEAYEKELDGIKDYDDILHYLQWKTPRVSFKSNKMWSGNYASASNWNREVREVYSELAYETIPYDYTEYARSLGENKLIEITEEYGMEILSVNFVAKQNGQTKMGENDGTFTIVGVENEKKKE